MNEATVQRSASVHSKGSSSSMKPATKSNSIPNKINPMPLMRKMKHKKQAFGNTDQFSTSMVNDDKVDAVAEDKVTPPATTDLSKHEGQTAGFAMEETYKMI